MYTDNFDESGLLSIICDQTVPTTFITVSRVLFIHMFTSHLSVGSGLVANYKMIIGMAIIHVCSFKHFIYNTCV